MTLPPLPEPAYSGAYLLPACKLPPVYTEAQMLALQRDTVEACAKLCRTLADKGFDVTYDNADSGAYACEDAIRSLLK